MKRNMGVNSNMSLHDIVDTLDNGGTLQVHLPEEYQDTWEARTYRVNGLYYSIVTISLEEYPDGNVFSQLVDGDKLLEKLRKDEEYIYQFGKLLT